jgi:site-specific DNA-methyltransferase (adenine-specific)
MKPHYNDDRVTLYHGDCIEVMRSLPDASVDAVVTDPPYGLEFMGKDWDAPWQSGVGVGEHNAGFSSGAPAVAGVRGAIKALPSFTGSTNPTCANCGGTKNGNDRKSRKRCRCEYPIFPNTTLPKMIAFEQWCFIWATEALRVLKPGGHLLAFGGTRTWHRLAVAIEDAGFEVRDSIAWMYGSGFPKSLDVSKAIDKRAGAEREVLSSKFRGENAGKSGGIQGNTVPRTDTITAPATPAAQQWQGWGTALKPAHEPIVVARKPLIGTVAANVLTHGTGAINIDGCRVGTDVRVNAPGSTKPRLAMGDHWRTDAESTTATGRWPANVILDESQAAELDAQSGVTGGGKRRDNVARIRNNGLGLGSSDDREGAANSPDNYGDSGGASRFFYVAKAGKKERPNVNGVAHPTVKPMALMQYLVRLVTPPGGTVLEPFAGSGTTIEAALNEGFNVIGIEMTDEYLPLIMARIERYGDKLC